MLLERAEIIVKEGQEAVFAEALKQRGRSLLEGVSGVLSLQIGQGVENPTKFMLLVHWTSMDAHMAFTQTPSFNEFRQLVAPHSVGGAMEHFLVD